MILEQQTKSQEKKWYERIAKYADTHGEFPKQDFEQYDMHHAFGRTFKHNKVAVGGWCVIPVAKRFHDVHSNNPWNVTHFKKRYEIEFGKQIDQFIAMCMVIKDEDGELPFGDSVIYALVDLK